MTSPKHQRGLTLIELLIGVTLAAIVLMITIPGFRELLERRRVEGVANELSADLQFARTEAVSRQATVTVATNAAGTQYTVASNVTKTVDLPTGITVTPSINRTYDGFRGTAGGTGGGNVSFDITSTATAATLRVNGSFMGRTEVCSPGQTLKGYSECP